MVDDEPLILRLAAHALRSAGFQVCEASSGLKAQEQFLQHAPDLVLTDLYMPQLDGPALARWVHKQGPTPVVFMTADTIMTYPDALPGPVLNKPFALKDLVDLIRATLPHEPLAQ